MAEKQLRTHLDAMRGALKKASLTLFWEAHRACLPLFGEGTHPAVRAKLWSEFRELSQQARSQHGS